MAISVIATGSVASAITNGENVTLNVSGLAQGDIIVVVGGIGGTTAGSQGVSGNNSGAFQQLDLNDDGACQFYAGWQRMGATPDTALTCVGNADAGDSTGYACITLRGASKATPPTAGTTAPASGSSTNPDPPAITYSGAGACVIVGALSVVSDGAGVTAPTGFTNETSWTANANDGEDATVAIAYDLTPGASPLNPASFTGWSTGVWRAVSIAIAADLTQTLTPSLVTDADTFHAPTVTRGARTATAQLYSDAESFYAPTVTAPPPQIFATGYPGGIGAPIGYPIGGVIIAVQTQALTVSLFTDPDTFYAPTVTKLNTLTASLLTDPDTFYVPTVSRGARTLTAALYTDADTFYVPSILRGARTLTAALYSDADTFYVPSILRGARTLTASLYTDPDTFYAPAIARSNTITAQLYSDADAFYAPSVLRGARTLTASLFTDDDTFYTPSILRGALTLTANLVTDADSFFTPSILRGALTLTVPLYSDPDTFFTPSILRGAVTLTVDLFADPDTLFPASVARSNTIAAELYTDADTFYTPTVLRGTVTLTAALYTDADTFYTPRFGISIQPQRYDDPDVFYAPTVSSPQFLTAVRYDDPDTFFEATVTSGAGQVVGAFYQDPDTFYAPSILRGALTLTASLYSDGDTFFVPSIASSYTLTASLYSDADTFFAPSIQRGAITLTASRYDDADTFYVPNILRGALTITASLVSDADTIFAPTLLRGARTLAANLVTDPDSFFSPTILRGARTLTVSRYDDPDSFFAATITSGAGQLATVLYTDPDTFFAPSIYHSQTLHTDADVIDGNWTNELDQQVDLFASIDEAAANDNDYIQSENRPTADIVRLAISNPTPPGVVLAMPFYVKYRYEKHANISGTCELKVRLYQQDTLIAEWVHSDVQEGFVDTTQELTAPQFNAITDFDDLFVEFEATYATGQLIGAPRIVNPNTFIAA